MAKDLARASDFLIKHPNQLFTFKILAARVIGYDRRPYQNVLRKGVSSIAKRIENRAKIGLLCRVHEEDRINKPIKLIGWIVPMEAHFDKVLREHAIELQHREMRRYIYAQGFKRAQLHIRSLPPACQKQLKLFSDENLALLSE